MTIIDAHCHYGTGDGLTGPWDTRADISKYTRRATQAGITRTALIPALSESYTTGNRQIADIMARCPGRYFGYIGINPVGDRGRVSSIVGNLVRGCGFNGIKIHHYNGSLTREVCTAAIRHSAPILWDVGEDMSKLEVIAGEYPDLTIIVPHLGSYADNWHAQKRCIDIMRRHRNVYTDTAGIRRFDLLVEAVRRVGAHRIIFGSDGPFHHPGVELEKIRQLPVSSHERGLICGGNFLRVLREARCRSELRPAPSRFTHLTRLSC